MTSAEKLPFVQSNRIGASTFIQSFPVDTRIESIRDSLIHTIPDNLVEGFERYGALQTLTSLEPVETIDVIRALSLYRTGSLEEQRQFENRKYILDALAQKGINLAKAKYMLDQTGELIEWSILGTPTRDTDSTQYELYGSLQNEHPEEDSHYVTERMYKNRFSHPVCDILSIDEQLARQATMSLVEQHTGDTPPEDMRSLLDILYVNSSSRMHSYETEGVRLTDTLELSKACLTNYQLGKKAFQSYSLEVSQILPSGSSISLSLTRTPNDHFRGSHYAATFGMDIIDRDTPHSPSIRATEYSKIVGTYREHPDFFFDALSEITHTFAKE